MLCTLPGLHGCVFPRNELGQSLHCAQLPTRNLRTRWNWEIGVPVLALPPQLWSLGHAPGTLESSVPHLYSERLDLSPGSFPAVQPKGAPVSSILDGPHDISQGRLGSAVVLGGAWCLHSVGPLCPWGSELWCWCARPWRLYGGEMGWDEEGRTHWRFCLPLALVRTRRCPEDTYREQGR